jgi:uncharacterized protein YjeT (DUF2065 family)
VFSTTLLLALGLLLVIEGLLPFVAPARWKELFARLLQLEDGQIRFMGLTAIVAGLVLILVLS